MAGNILLYCMEQINRAVKLLSQALGVVSNALPNDKTTSEAKSHIKKAIQKIEVAQNHELNKKVKKQSLHEKWWGTVTSGIANQPMSQKAAMRTIEELDKMIQIEKKIIETEFKQDPKLLNG